MRTSTIAVPAICLAVATAGCQPRPKRDEAPVSPTPIQPAAQVAGQGSERSIELTLDGPEAVVDSERLSATGDGVLFGAWPRAGARMDLDEQAAPLDQVLQRIARVARLNFVLNDGVRGRVTARLSRVPWTRALQAVLAAFDLVAVLEGNVVRVLPRTQWERERRSAGYAPG